MEKITSSFPVIMYSQAAKSGGKIRRFNLGWERREGEEGPARPSMNRVFFVLSDDRESEIKCVRKRSALTQGAAQIEPFSGWPGIAKLCEDTSLFLMYGCILAIILLGNV